MPVRKDLLAARTLHRAIHQFLDCLFRPDLIIQTASLPTLRRHHPPSPIGFQGKLFNFSILSFLGRLTLVFCRFNPSARSAAL
jgi:hypothetical protein